MIRFVLLLFLSFITNVVQAQSVPERIEAILNSRPRTMPKYGTAPKPNVLYLKSDFNNSLFEDKAQLESLKDKEILRVELVYTTYKKNEEFDQRALNKKRLEKLYATVPELATQQGVDFILIAQTACTSPEEGKNYFHGVVITYRDKPNEVLTKVETSFLRDVKATKAHSYSYSTYVNRETKALEAIMDTTSSKEPVIVLPEFPGGERSRVNYFTKYLNYPTESTKPGRVNVQFIIDKKGDITAVNFPNSPTSNPCQEEVKDFVMNMPDWKPGTMDGKPVECVVQFSVDFTSRGSVIPSPIEIFTTEAPPKKSSLPGFNYNEIKPTNSSNKVITALTKSDLTNAVIVCDVTGSMAPYSAEIIEFIQNQIKGKKVIPSRFVFFNDGDMKRDKTKKVGETGGIYKLTSANLDSIVEYMIRVMEKGNGGGDLPENNLEAVLYAKREFADAKEIILIADNFATPRDLKLCTELTVPVKVIVCGGAILNEAYLDIVYYSRGTLIYNDAEITNISSFEEGATVRVGNMTYMLSKGHFKLKRN